MNLKTIILKAAGGMFAVGMVATSFFAGAPSASADLCPSPPCFAPATPGSGIGSAFRPDLELKELKVDKVVDVLIIQVTIMHNGGTSITESFRTDIAVNGDVVKSYTLPGLISGNGKYYTFTVPAPAGGKAIVTATVDAGHTVYEGSKELNNVKVQTLFY